MQNEQEKDAIKELTQSDLNQDMVDLGVGRYRARIESAKKREAESETKYGQRLIRGGLPTYSKAIKDMVDGWDNRNSALWQLGLREMKPSVIGFIVIKAVLDCITLKKNMAAVSHFVGSRVEDQHRCDFLVKNNEAKGEGIVLGAQRRRGGLLNQRRHIKSSMRNEADKGLMPGYTDWRRRDKLSCGLTLVELLRHVTGIIEYVYILEKAGKKPTRYVTASKGTLDWIENYNEDKELFEPFWLPTADAPLPWDSIWEGGYDTVGTALPKLPFIKTSNMDFLRTIENDKLEVPMEACNLIQGTPWVINPSVLRVAKWAWQNNVEVGALPSKEDEQLPEIPNDFHENEESNRKWRQTAAGIYSRNASTKSKRLLTSKIIFTAEKLSASRFFYPSHCDFRGRVYNIASSLSVMGNDLCRGLLQFARTERLANDNDAKWLAVAGANAWGNDKVTLDERWKWSEAFTNDAIKIAKNPERELLWTEADKPWAFLAWANEWAAYKLNGKINSALPVNMDASNNGLQILSMLTRDPYGMEATNVLPTTTPQDIYGVVAANAVQTLKAQAATGDELARAWVAFGIDRRTCKRPVMCYSYGLTPYSNRAYINEWYDEQIHGKKRDKPFPDDKRYYAIHMLAEHVWRGIESVLEKPKECMDWFQACTRLIANENRALSWVSPTGFPVHQEYYKVHNQQVNTYISGKATCVKFREDDDEVISRRRMVNGASPNVVHSLDASALHETVVRANKNHGIYDFSFIHDSYGTHSNKCDELSSTLREVFVDFFSRDLLNEWRTQLTEQHPDLDFPVPPEFGDAEINKIKESTYFFS